MRALVVRQILLSSFEIPGLGEMLRLAYGALLGGLSRFFFSRLVQQAGKSFGERGTVFTRGSHARGNAIPFLSDLDLGIIIRGDSAEAYQLIAQTLQKTRLHNPWLRDLWQATFAEKYQPILNRNWHLFEDLPNWRLPGAHYTPNSFPTVPADRMGLSYLYRATLAAKSAGKESSFKKAGYYLAHASAWSQLPPRASVSATEWKQIDFKVKAVAREVFYKTLFELCSKLPTATSENTVEDLPSAQDGAVLGQLEQLGLLPNLHAVYRASGYYLILKHRVLIPDLSAIDLPTVRWELHTPQSFALRRPWAPLVTLYGESPFRLQPQDQATVNFQRALYLPNQLAMTFVRGPTEQNWRYLILQAKSLSEGAGTALPAPSARQILKSYALPKLETLSIADRLCIATEAIDSALQATENAYTAHTQVG